MALCMQRSFYYLLRHTHACTHIHAYTRTRTHAHYIKRTVYYVET